MSLGIASLSGSKDESGELLVANADAAAYRAKRLGGNRACIFDSDLDLAVPSGQHGRIAENQRERPGRDVGTLR